MCPSACDEHGGDANTCSLRPLHAVHCRSYCFFDTPANVAAQVQRARVNSAGNTACDVRNTHQYTVASNPYAFAIVAFDNANNYVQSAQYELRTGATNAAGTQPELTGGLAALLILWAILLIF